MENEFSMRELEDVFLKTTLPIEIDGKHFAAGEALCVFDKIQIANFNELKTRMTAHGGFADRDRVFWEDTKGVEVSFIQGIFNELQFALLCNGKLIYSKRDEKVLISQQEEVESDEEGMVEFKYQPAGAFFIYDKVTGEKIEDCGEVIEKKINIGKPYKEVILHYQFDYSGNSKVLQVGRRLIEGFLSLEGRTRVKDDISGKVRTGIIQIPKLKLMSDLSMRLGEKANPVAANFKILALPYGERSSAKVMNIFFLDDDIDSDM